ncbi:MAG: hypothetical protein N2252_08115 [Candidatus Kryptonium sp.]|nr:hypothetical protein [Candidatus Kryptonium sp.]
MRAILIILSIFISADFLCAQNITRERGRTDKFKDILAVRWLDPRFGEFPDASLVDFSFLLDSPAGKYGFVRVGEDGHFYFEKTGKRARFWGVTIAGSHVDIPKEKIETVVEVLARAGCNIIRLHELDNRGGEKFGIVRRNVIDEAHPNENNSRNLDKEYLDKIDYWIYQAQKRGIYIYLVLRAYRTFKVGDGIYGAEKMERKGSPYGLFDEKMIELQKEFIDNFLFKHVNPYTGKPNGLNPAVAMIELINEDSFFFQYDKLDQMIEPYKSKFLKMWVQFLQKKYGNTDNLRKAWTTKDGFSVLSDDESIEMGKVDFPKFKIKKFTDLNEDKSSRLEHPLRQKDGVEFLMSLQMKLFKSFKEFIRSKGCPIPLTATVNSEFINDTYTVAAELDFIGQNMYMDHPSFEVGKEWVGFPVFKNENYLKRNDRWSFPVYSSFYAWEGKPIVIREWALCYPNEYRASSLIHIAVYSLLQDYDAVIYFAFYTWGDVNICSPFGLQSDPTRWGLFGYAAKIFINGEIKPFQKKLNVCFYPEDLKIWADWWSKVYKLSKNFKLRNKVVEKYNLANSDEINIFARDVFKNGSIYKFIDSLVNLANGEVKIDSVNGTLLVDSKYFKSLAGEIDTSKVYELGKFKIKTSSPVSAIVFASLDNFALDSSNKIAVKVVTVAKNRGQVFEKVEDRKFILRNQGSAPVQTHGEKSDSGVEIWISDKRILKCFMRNGSFEVLIDNKTKRVFIFCDTPNIKFKIHNHFFRVGKITRFFQEIGGEDHGKIGENGEFVYPGYSKYVMIY